MNSFQFSQKIKKTDLNLQSLLECGWSAASTKKKSEKSKKKSLPSHNLKIAKNNNHNNKNLVLREIEKKSTLKIITIL